MEIKSIFVRHLPAVKDLHDSVKEDLKRLETAVIEADDEDLDPDLGEQYLCLYDVLLAGQKIKSFDDPHSFKAYRVEMASALDAKVKTLPMVNKYKVFNKAEITGLAANYEFIAKRPKDPTLHHASPSRRDLERLSFRMRAPSTLLALKYFWLHLGYGEVGSLFNGMLASTSPVRKGLIRLYGTDFKSQLAASMQQQRMAVETGIDAFTLNSVLWFIGQLP